MGHQLYKHPEQMRTSTMGEQENRPTKYRRNKLHSYTSCSLVIGLGKEPVDNLVDTMLALYPL